MATLPPQAVMRPTQTQPAAGTVAAVPGQPGAAAPDQSQAAAAPGAAVSAAAQTQASPGAVAAATPAAQNAQGNQPWMMPRVGHNEMSTAIDQVQANPALLTEQHPMYPILSPYLQGGAFDHARARTELGIRPQVQAAPLISGPIANPYTPTQPQPALLRT